MSKRKRLREQPLRRVNPSGEVVYVARVTDKDGKLVIYKPEWNRRRGTFARQGDAQRAINEFYEQGQPKESETVGAYFETWTERHPRAERTNDTNEHRIERVLDVEVDGRKLRDWPYRELKRKHALALVDHMLREQGRAKNGAVNILRALSAMTEDAITDEAAEVNFVKGVRIRSTDPRIQKQGRPARVFTFEQMHVFAGCGVTEAGPIKPARDYRPMLRTFTDTMMRLGEVLPLERGDLFFDSCGDPSCRASGAHFHVTKTAHEGRVSQGTKNDHGEAVAGRVAPCPPTLERMLRTMPTRIDSALLFPTPMGKVWTERNFYREVWHPAREAAELDIRPHDCRHSGISHLLAAGIDKADLADTAGHTVETMHSRYTHPLGKSFEQIRRMIG